MSVDDLIHGLCELDTAHDQYEMAYQYVSGEVPEVFASPRIQQLIEVTGQHYKFGLAATPVKVLSNRLRITGVTTGIQSADNAVSSIRESSRLDTIEPETTMMTSTYGDGYLFSWPRFDGESIVGFDVLRNDPRIVRAIYDPDNPSVPRFVIKSWLCVDSEGKELRRADLYYDKQGEYAARIERYVTVPDAGEDDKKSEKWTTYVEDGQSDEDWLIEHDYGMPWNHFRNGTPYGFPEHKAAYGAQNAVNKNLVTQLTTMDSHGWPQRYGLVDREAVLGENNDDPDEEDDYDIDETDRPVGGKSSNQRSGPGTMQLFTGLKDVGQFTPADPSVFLTPVDTYVRIMSQLTDTPLWDFDPSREQPSGVARRRAEKPLIDKIENRKLYYSPEWQRFWVRLLNLMGERVDRVTVSWSPSSTIDDLEGWAILQSKHSAGVPWRVLLVEAGYTPEEVAEWLESSDNGNSGGEIKESPDSSDDEIEETGRASNDDEQ